MARAALRPVAHDDRLSLVEHLDELRTRLIICVVAFVAALGVCLWQSDRILEIVNQPLEQATAHRRASDPLEQAAQYQRQGAGALSRLAPVLQDAERSAKTPQERERARGAAAAAVQAARASPPSTARRPVTLGVGE